jgi:hypothetical protein
MRWTFVVQLGAKTQATARHFEGSIEEVATGRERRFRSTDELLSFLSDCAAEPRDSRATAREGNASAPQGASKRDNWS